MKRLMSYAAVVLATLLLLALLWQFRQVLALFVASLLMAAVVRPSVDKLEQWGIPRSTGQVLLYIIGLGGLALIVFLVGELFLAELNATVNRLVLQYETLYRRWEEGAGWQQNLLTFLPPLYESATADEVALEEMLPVVLSAAQGITNAIGGLLLLMALSVYWSIDQNRFERLWLSLLPARQRVQARDTWREVENSVGTYLRSQAAQSLLTALFLGLGAAIFGLRPFVFAFMGAFAALIPVVGGVLAALIGFGLGYLQGIEIGLLAALYTISVFIGLALFVEPRLWPREKQSYFLTILLMVPLVMEFAVWGLLIAPLLAVAIEVVVRTAYQSYLGNQGGATRLEDLEVRYQAMISKHNGEGEASLFPETQNLADRLSGILNEVRELNKR